MAGGLIGDKVGGQEKQLQLCGVTPLI